MKEKRLKIIVSAMAIALIGLIAVQLYWVVNVIKIEEARFESNVSDAINFVVDKIDKSEIAERIVKQFVLPADSLRYSVEDNKSVIRKVLTRGGMPKDGEVKIVTSGTDTNFEVNVELLSDTVFADSKAIFYSYSTNSSDVKTKTISNKHLTAFVNKKKEVMEDVIEELVFISRVVKIEDRIQKSKLDSLLNAEFKNIGISADYNFGVLNTNTNDFVYMKEEEEKGILKESKFKAQLFPKDIIAEPNFLFVSFPNQREYVIKSISATLGLSIGFILLIIFIFYKTVQMLIKQKKITEIKNDLINNITHEFKTPLSTISLACEALNEPKLSTDGLSVLRYSKIINDENTRIRNLVDNLLSSASLEKGEFEINRQIIDVHSIIADVVNQFELQLENQKGNFRNKLRALNSSISADPFHLSVIFNNIIDNALKYNEREPEILIATENKEEKIIITVSDNGIGIKKNELKNIFDSFYRVPTGNIHNVKGSGMGLHYAKKLTVANGGEISLSSVPGVGSIFQIEFKYE
jgi:two-component system phosphate regulon sensor histidine kinase PhoR